MMKKICHKNDDKIVVALEFGVFSSEELSNQSVVKITNSDFYDETKKPVQGGLLDTKLGVYKKGQCPSCGEIGNMCIGHFGNIKLTHFIYPYHYLKDIIKILKSICKECGHILLESSEKRYFNKKLNNPNRNYIQKKKIRKEIISYTEKKRICSNCNMSNGSVKKLKSLCMIFHQKYILKSSLQQYEQSMSELPHKIQSAFGAGYEIIRPEYAYNLFKKVPVTHYKYLCFNRKNNLSSLIFKNITVPPTCIRMSILNQDSSREDDLSRCLQMMIGQKKLADITNNYTRMIRPSAATATNRNEDKAIRGIVQRLSGKKGRFRHNLMGKRTNYTSRTVISPDPTLRIDEVSIPLHCALRLTFVERVTDYNIEYLRAAVLNGPERYPGAEKILKATNKSSIVLKNLPETKLLVNPSDWVQIRSVQRQKEEAKNLRVGDFVERHIVDGDTVLFNRQPSLHRLSFQSFSVVVKKERTFSFNPCVCNPFNADFDGDEMNIHFLQNNFAKAECQYLLSSIDNIASPNSGEPLTSPLQDILTAAYLFTSMDTFFTEHEFQHIVGIVYNSYTRRPNMTPNIPRPSIIKPQKLYTGKQVISMIISPYKAPKLKKQLEMLPEIRINMTSGNKAYKANEDLNSNDSYVVIHNSDLVIGQLDKKLLGGGSKNSIFYRMIRDSNNKACAASMERLCNVTLPFLKEHGFSIGLNDVTPSLELRKIKARLVESNFQICQQFINDYELKNMSCDPGSNLEQTLETKISSQLSKIRDEGGNACKVSLSKYNAALIMALCGSKGSLLNVSQMVFCVGQQIIDGKRVREVPGLNRTMIFFDVSCKSPEAKGFVRNSFRSGLMPSEFMFHAMSGREGLIDTSVKTAESGYMQRRLIKCLEDLTVYHDKTVRDSTKTVIQFNYGVDNYDSMKVDIHNKPCDLDHELNHALQIITYETRLFQKNFKKVFDKLMKPYVKYEVYHQLKDDLIVKLNEYLSSRNGKKFGISESQLESFIGIVFQKYRKAKVEAGTPVGVLCGQSIGEPATQMTLKTFHFAGVSSMNITQGLPRFTEILNGVTNIKTPIVQIIPEDKWEKNESVARSIQMSIQPVLLGSLIKRYDCESSENQILYLVLDKIKLTRLKISKYDLQNMISSIKLEYYILTVLDKIDNHKDMFIEVVNANGKNVCKQLVKNVLSKLQVNGCPGVKGTVIKKEDNGSFKVYVEGGQFDQILTKCLPHGAKASGTTTNHIIDVYRVLGIEAARATIIDQLHEVMESYNLAPGERHLDLAADFMCVMGEVFGFQRNGMERSKCSVLSLAAFEKTMEHLTEASYHNQKDEIHGVTDNIVFGNSVPVGTGQVHLLYDDALFNNNKNANNTQAKIHPLLRKRKFVEANL